ncbi:MAG: tetratricopeptide repeat protein [Desulfobacteraceae bacterium]|nr:tetratricopeptide repeat protein [Desulfobacteraceae bacterium]
MKKLSQILILITILFLPSYSYSAVIKKIGLEKSGEKIVINLDQYTDFRVFQSDKNEVIITFKGADLYENVVTSGSGGDFISKILYEEFPDKISIISILTKKEIVNLTKNFNYSDMTLEVELMPNQLRISNKSPFYTQKRQLESESRKQDQKQSRKEDLERQPVAIEKSNGLKKENEKPENKDRILIPVPGEKLYDNKGSVETITDFIEQTPCHDSINIKVALRLVRENSLEDALGRAQAELKGVVSPECEGNLRFFNSWLKYKNLKQNKDNNGLYSLKNEVESLLLRYPESSALPYGYALAGLINKDLSNYPMAKGWFEIAEKNFPDYKGMAEIYFSLGEIHYEENDLRLSEEYLDKLENKYPDTKFNEDAKLIHGQILYSRKRYFDTIRTLGPFIKENSRVIYEKPDLLKFVADSYFLTGSNEKARDIFSRIFNMFPDMEQKDIILANIGETYENQGDKKKAEKIYRLVTERYPGSEGFVKSSLKLADNMEDLKQRESIYKMIINDFPDSVEARISLLRLATIYNTQKRFEESIDVIKILLVENPRALRKDALHIMSEAVTGYLENQLKEGNSASALRMTEKNRFYIADMKNYRVHFVSGRVYNETHMYEEAKERLDLAYKLYPDKKNIPFELMKYMVLTDIELGNYNDALKICDEISASFKDGEKKAFASEKKGDIYRTLNNFDQSVSFYDKAVSQYDTQASKAEVLVKLGDIYKSEGRNFESSQYFDNSVKMYSSIDKEKYKNQIAYAARNSGEINLKLKKFEKAVSSFKTVLDFNATRENPYEARFNLGESLRGLGRTQDALNEYRAVFSAEEADELFKKLAEQRIREIELEDKLDKS